LRFALPLMWKLGRPFEPAVGSGKSGSPWERMHPAYLSAAASSDADAAELEQPEDEQPAMVERDEVVVAPVPATDGAGEPPQPAATSARAPTPRATAATCGRRRRRRQARTVRPDCCWSTS